MLDTTIPTLKGQIDQLHNVLNLAGIRLDKLSAIYELTGARLSAILAEANLKVVRLLDLPDYRWGKVPPPNAPGQANAKA
jgi:hypothetical protein